MKPKFCGLTLLLSLLLGWCVVAPYNAHVVLRPAVTATVTNR